ncbi:MAG: RPA family protein [Haloarculaceae archaeon]|jgi:RPA family protein
MSANSNLSVKQRAANISGEFGQMGIDVPAADIQAEFSQMTEFKVPVADAERSIVRRVINEYDLENSDLAEGVAALAGFGGNANPGSRAFEPTLLADVPALGDEEWVDVRAQVTDLWEVNHDSMRQVGLIADESAQMKFVVWAKNTDDLPTLEEGVTYDLASVITNEYEGKYSISLNKASTVGESEEVVEPTDGKIRATGTLVALEEGSGLIKRCPHEDCSRVVQNGRCSEHGAVDGVFDLRLKAILDDGSRAIRALFNAEMAEQVTGVSLEEAKEMAAEAFDAGVVEAAFREALIGTTFDVRGPVIGEYFLVDEAVETTYSSENPGLGDPSLADAVTQRQPAKRVFAQELNAATHSFTRSEDEGDERAPKFTLLPSGEAANRVLVVGTLIETSDVGSDSEFWKGRVMAASEAVNIYAGQYQAEAMDVLRSATTPAYVAVVGKIHHYETDYGVNVSIQPEHISIIGGEVRDSWVAETIDATQQRLGALASGEAVASDAVATVYGEDVSDIEAAVEAAAEDLASEPEARADPVP